MEKLNKPIRMVVCDLDGTLLYSTKKITDRNKDAICALRNRGVKFGICSGRSAVALKTMLALWGIDQDVDFVIGFNGAMYMDPATGSIEETDWLTPKAIAPVMESLKGYRLAMAEYHGDGLYSTADNPIVRQMARRNRLSFHKVRPDWLLRNSLKFMAVGMPWTISRYLKSGEPARLKTARVFRSGPFLLEFVHPQLSKLEGVKKACERFGCSLDEVVTFGNDNNDLEMLAGTVGVAMANALPAIKEAAKYVTASNRHDGTAVFMEKYILTQPPLQPDKPESSK